MDGEDNRMQRKISLHGSFEMDSAQPKFQWEQSTSSLRSLFAIIRSVGWETHRVINTDFAK